MSALPHKPDGCQGLGKGTQRWQCLVLDILIAINLYILGISTIESSCPVSDILIAMKKESLSQLLEIRAAAVRTLGLT